MNPKCYKSAIRAPKLAGQAYDGPGQAQALKVYSSLESIQA